MKNESVEGCFAEMMANGVEWELAHEPHHGAFREDWDANVASAMADQALELAGLEDEDRYNQECYDAMVASGEIVEVEALEADPFPF